MCQRFEKVCYLCSVVVAWFVRVPRRLLSDDRERHEWKWEPVIREKRYRQGDPAEEQNDRDGLP